MDDQLKRRVFEDCGFSTVTVEFETLRTEFVNCGDWSLRQCLLQEMQSKLIEMDLLLERAHRCLRLPQK